MIAIYRCFATVTLNFPSHAYIHVMTTIRPFVCDDLFEFNNVNLDPLTETVHIVKSESQITRPI